MALAPEEHRQLTVEDRSVRSPTTALSLSGTPITER